MSVQSAASQRFDSLKSGVHKIVERATTKPTWFGRTVDRASELVRAHPIAAVGIALGIGYVVFRTARRR